MAEKLLEEACYYEKLAKHCGPLDPAYNYFIRQREACFNEALEAEKV